MDNYFILSGRMTAAADLKMNNDTVKNMWRSFCLGDGALTLTEGPDCTFSIGTTALPELPEGKEYALTIDEHGAAVVGRDYGGLMRGFLVLLMKIDYTEEGLRMAFTREQSAYVRWMSCSRSVWRCPI